MIHHNYTMQEAAIDILFTVDAPLNIKGIETLAEMMGVDMDSRNCGGWWEITLERAGLIEYASRPNFDLGYKLTTYALETILAR